VSTPPEGLQAEVAYYPDLAALKADTSERARGRIVFIDQKTERTTHGATYGTAVAARRSGASEAAKRGAVAVAIRSIGTDRFRTPHTGNMRYEANVPRIPAIAVSVADAEVVARLAAHPASASRPLALHMSVQNETDVPATTHNVIGEIAGTNLAGEVVMIGAHLDSWDLGTGAIDDGAGVGIVVAAAKVILDGGARPRRTVRVVLFGNEENGLDGAKAYAERYKEQRHQLVGESDDGSGTVWRLRSRVLPAALPVVAKMGEILAPLGIEAGDNLGRPGADADWGSTRHHWPALSLEQHSPDYFDWHHTANDTLERIDPATMPQNVAAWAVVTWLAAQSDAAFGPLPPPDPPK
jgi:hypothetical protein